MGCKSAKHLSAAEDALRAKLLELKQQNRMVASGPESLEEAKLRFRLAAHPIFLDLIYARPLPASVAALGVGFALGLSPRLRAVAVDLALSALKR